MVKTITAAATLDRSSCGDGGYLAGEVIRRDLERAWQRLSTLGDHAAPVLGPASDIGLLEASMSRIVHNFERAMVGLGGVQQDDLPLPEWIEGRLRRFQHLTGITTRLQPGATWSDRVQGDGRRHLLAILDEALHNIHQHAGAGSVVVGLLDLGPRVVLTIADDGIGLLPEACGAGYGVRGMRERAALLRGRLAIDPAPGGGTAVSLIFPWEDRR